MWNMRNLIQKQAKALGKDIAKAYGREGVRLAIELSGFKNGMTVFEIRLRGSTHEEDARKHARHVQFKLQLPVFRLYREKFSLFLVVSEQKIRYQPLLEILANPIYKAVADKMELPCVVGYNALGEVIIIDLAREHHQFKGGASGWGKSVSLQAQCLSLAAFKSPADVNLLLIDVGANSLMFFEGLPHLSCPVAQDAQDGLNKLLALKDEMEMRIKFANNSVPKIVCVIDETTALVLGMHNQAMLKLLKQTSLSLLQRGRHANIQMVLCSQNPAIQNMKIDLANITSRMAFKCSKPNFSEVILGETGAELLSEEGEMLYKSSQLDGTQHLQGIFISEDDLQWAVSQIKKRTYPPEYYAHKFIIADADLSQAWPESDDAQTAKQKRDDKLLAEIILRILGHDDTSSNWISKTLGMKWDKADGFIQTLNSWGIVGELDAKKRRTVFARRIEDLPAEAMELLSANGVSEFDITAAFEGRQ